METVNWALLIAGYGALLSTTILVSSFDLNMGCNETIKSFSKDSGFKYRGLQHECNYM